MKLKQQVAFALRELSGLHAFSRNVLYGCAQFSAVLYVFAMLFYAMAPHAPDYFAVLAYARAAIATAPVVLACGIVLALLFDLVLRKKPEE